MRAPAEQDVGSSTLGKPRDVSSGELRDASSCSGGEMRLPAEPAKLGLAREYAHKAAVAFGLDGDRCFEFVFAVNEAVTNAIRHGAPDEHGQIRLHVRAEGECLTLAIHDHGTFMASDGGAVSPERGRGLALMASLMDSVQLCVAPGSTIVRLSKARA
jgi:anti-sigma regulatory factor (Ser/Thr protein kinase)